MNLLIVAATNDEVLVENLTACDVLITGIGMVNTSIELSRCLSNKKPDLVINIGVAGSFNKSLPLGGVFEIIKDTFSELGVENNSHFFSSKSITNLPSASSITVNTVHGNKENISSVYDKFKPDLESMEGAACMFVCDNFKIPCLQIRAISNYVEERNKSKWDLPLAIQQLNIETRKIIEEL
jgi:futalosine hydrolase